LNYILNIAYKRINERSLARLNKGSATH